MNLVNIKQTYKIARLIYTRYIQRNRKKGKGERERTREREAERH